MRAEKQEEKERVEKPTNVVDDDGGGGDVNTLSNSTSRSPKSKFKCDGVKRTQNNPDVLYLVEEN